MTNTLKGKFDDLPWHDATLLRIAIDRRSPGHSDEVELIIEWPEGQRGRLVFTNCRALDAQLNFGIIALESILGAECNTESPRIAQIRGTWRDHDMDFSDLLSFEIETNSTAGTIRVVASGFEFRDPPDDSWFPLNEKIKRYSPGPGDEDPGFQP